MSNLTNAHFNTSYSAHFAMAVVHKPWACLENSEEQHTTLLYFDSMRRSKPLATCKQFARVILEFDAVRRGADISEPTDAALIDRIASSLIFKSVEVSCLSILCIHCLNWFQGTATRCRLPYLRAQFGPQPAGTFYEIAAQHEQYCAYLYEWGIHWILAEVSMQLFDSGTALYREKPQFDRLRRNIAEWLLSNLAEQPSLTRYNQNHWSKLPDSLSWIRARFMDKYIETRLGMDPDVTVEVQGK